MSDPRTVEGVMGSCGLTDEEAWFVLKLAGHHGYDEAARRLSPRGRLRRMRQAVLWVGGWEWPDLCRAEFGKPAWEPWRDGRWVDPTPVTLLRRLTFFGKGSSGWWGQLRAAGTILVFGTAPSFWAYVSPNGTPGHPGARDLVGNRAARERLS